MTYYPDGHPAFDMPEFNPEPPEEDDPDQGYDPSDPKHPTYHERMSDLSDERTAPILPAGRRLSLYRAIARKMRHNPDGQGVRRAALEMALEARRDICEGGK